jgi:lambda family phage tail tape measure protein
MGVSTSDLQFRVLASVVGAQALDQLNGQMKNLQNASNSLSSGLKLIATYFSGQQAVAYGKSILDTADTYQKLSEKTGLAVSTIAEFAGGAEAADVPLEGLAKGLNRLGLNIVEAANGNKELAGTFAGLGITLKDSNGNLKNAGDVTKDLADKFSRLRDGPEKSAIAIKLFGKAGADLIPFLDQGSESVERFSLAIDQDFASRAEEFNDTIKAIGVNLKNGTISSLRELLPPLQEIGSALEEFTKSGGESTGFMEGLGEAARILALGFVTSFTAIKESIDAAITGFREAKAFLSGNSSDVTKLDADLRARIQASDAAEAKFAGRLRKNSLLFGAGSASQIQQRQAIETQAANRNRGGTANTDAIGENAKTLQAMDERIAKVKAETLAVDQSNQQRQAAALISELESKGINESSKYYEIYKNKIIDAYTALATAQERVQADDFRRQQRETLDVQMLQLQNYDMSADALQKLVEAKTLDNQATEASRKFTDEGRQAYLDAAEAVKQQKLALIDLNQQQKETWSVGAKQAFRDYLDNARDVAAQTKSLFTDAFSNMEDALVSFVKTGKLSFTQFADGVVTDIIRIQVRALLAQAVTGATNLFAGFMGGISTTPGGTVAGGAGDAGAAAGAVYSANGNVVGPGGAWPLRKYASGGIASSPQVSIFGEGSKPEAYVPLQDGRTIPVTVKGAGGGDSTSVSVTVNVEKGTTQTQSDSAVGAQLGKSISAAVRQELINQKRPGGLLA